MAGKQFSLDSRMDLVSTIPSNNGDGEEENVLGDEDEDSNITKGRLNSIS